MPGCPALMLEAGAGAIVTVGSRASLGAGPAGLAYATTKHGLLGMVKSIAYYYGPQGIRSNAALPGGVHSEMHKSSPRSGWAFERAQLAKRRCQRRERPIRSPHSSRGSRATKRPM